MFFPSFAVHAITSNFDWLTVMVMDFVMGESDYLGFGLIYDTQLKTALSQTAVT